MLSFSSSLSSTSEALVIFVDEKYNFKDKNSILSKELTQKINTFIKTLKTKNKEDEIHSFDLAHNKACFVIKIKKKKEKSYFEEIGGTFFTFIRNCRYSCSRCNLSTSHPNSTSTSFKL